MSVESAFTTDWTMTTTAENVKLDNDEVDIFIHVSNPEHGEKEERQKIKVSLSQTSDQLIEDIRQRLNIPAEKSVRLHLPDNVGVDATRTLGENGVKAGSVLCLAIIPGKDGLKSGAPLATQDEYEMEEEQGPKNGKIPVHKMDDVQLLLNIRFLVDHLFRRSSRVWPRDTVGHVIANATISTSADASRPDEEPEFVLSMRSPSSSTLPMCRAPSTTLFIDGAPLQLSLSADIQDSLQAWLPLEDDDVSDSSLSTVVERERLALKVTLGNGATYSWTTDQTHLSLADVISQLETETASKEVLKEPTLYCSGCGRKLSEEESEFQMVPVACCSIRSLELTANRPALDNEEYRTEKVTKEQSSQTDCETTDAESQSDAVVRKDKSIGASPTVSTKGIPTIRRITASRSTQVYHDSFEAAVQTEALPSVDQATCCEDNLTDRTSDVPIHLRLKPTKKELWFCARPDDTLGHLVALLRRARCLMGVTDLRRGRRSLRSPDSDWRLKSLLGDCGLHAGDELHIDTVTSPSVFTAVESPTRNAAEVRTIPLSPGDGDWDAVKPQLQLSTRAVACQWGAFHSRANQAVVRHSIFCFDPAKGQSAGYRDEEDGKELDPKAEVSHWSHEFVKEGSGLRASPQLVPVLSVLLAPKVLNCVDDELCQTTLDQLFEPEYIALVLGLEHTASQKWFVELSPGLTFCNSESGEVYRDAEAVVRAQRRYSEVSEDEEKEEGGWYRLLILLRHGDPVPRCEIPESRFVYVRVRHPVSVDVEDDRIWRTEGDPVPGESIWTMTPDINSFQRKFTESMRR